MYSRFNKQHVDLSPNFRLLVNNRLGFDSLFKKIKAIKLCIKIVDLKKIQT